MFRVVINFNIVWICAVFGMFCVVGIFGMVVGNENIFVVMGGNVVVFGVVCYIVIYLYIMAVVFCLFSFR